MMNQRITLQRRASAPDRLGQPVDDWHDIAGVWGDLRFLPDPAQLAAGTQGRVDRCAIRIRSRPDIEHATRVHYMGQAYDIASALPDERDRRFMLLACARVR